MKRRTRWAWAVGFALLLLAGLLWLPPELKGLSFVLRAAGMRGAVVDSLASHGTGAFHVTDLRVPTRHGPVRGRLYEPDERKGRLIVLTSGVHAAGIDEPRLVKLAEDLAMGGQPVLTPEPPDLLRYEITPRLPDVIEDTALWVLGPGALAPDGQVDLFGISFSGGLSVVAAGRPSLRDRVSAVLSFGGHGELSRVLSFLCTGVQADGVRRTPHDYGVVVILLNVADRLVPPEQVAPLRKGVLTFMHASHLTLVDSKQAEAAFQEARALESTLPEPAATLLHQVNTRDVAALGPRLLPFVEGFAGDPSLSPEHSPAPRAPVYLLHGTDDSVIPAIESTLLARALKPYTRVHLRPTPLITHAEMDRKASVVESLKLVRFWASLLGE
jgi:dienelactone hydrolase